jgi:hypothetical protein
VTPLYVDLVVVEAEPDQPEVTMVVMVADTQVTAVVAVVMVRGKVRGLEVAAVLVDILVTVAMAAGTMKAELYLPAKVVVVVEVIIIPVHTESVPVVVLDLVAKAQMALVVSH